jgi:MarR family transcriptional regulator, organic hydroperoxide resistance regulator
MKVAQRETDDAECRTCSMTRASTARKPPNRDVTAPKARRDEAAAEPRSANGGAAYRASVHDPLDSSIPFLLRRTSRYFRLSMQNRLRRYDLVFSHWFFLRALWLKDGITQRELCKRIEAPEPAAVAALRVLERKGYVRRVRDKDNLRKILVFITPKGFALREKLMPHAFELAEVGVKGISKQELAQLRSLLNKIRDNMVAVLQAELGEIDE